MWQTWCGCCDGFHLSAKPCSYQHAAIPTRENTAVAAQQRYRLCKTRPVIVRQAGRQADSDHKAPYHTVYQYLRLVSFWCSVCSITAHEIHPLAADEALQ